MSNTFVSLLCCATLLGLTTFAPSAHAHERAHKKHVEDEHSSVVVVTPPPANVQLVTPSPRRGHRPDQAPSVLKYALDGFFGGSLAGLSTGYLVLRDQRRPDLWRGYVLATGIGALSGSGMGLVLGLFDAAAPERPARYIMRDAAYGTLLGGVLGATVGGLVALNSHNGKDALLGAAIGGVSGLGLGGLVGVLEGQRKPRFALLPSLSASRDIRGERALGAGVYGRF